jgi:hypothetical protein
MNQVQIFENKEFGQIRIVEKDGQPWWVLKDVGGALGLSDTSRIAERLDCDELTRVQLVSGGQNRSMYAVSESGIYAVILRSDKKPKAKDFRRWITGVVLPSIRKHGAYITEETARSPTVWLWVRSMRFMIAICAITSDGSCKAIMIFPSEWYSAIRQGYYPASVRAVLMWDIPITHTITPDLAVSLYARTKSY